MCARNQSMGLTRCDYAGECVALGARCQDRFAFRNSVVTAHAVNVCPAASAAACIACQSASETLPRDRQGIGL